MAGNDKMPGWLKSLKASGFGQFLGSDVYVGYTARYVWQANQLGHFALGFAIGHLLYWICVSLYGFGALVGWFAGDCSALVRPCAPLAGFIDVGWVPLVVIGLFVLLYFGKEYADYLLAKYTYGETFPLDEAEIARIRRDGVIDAGFVALGALLVVVAPPAVFIPLIAGGVAAWFVRRRELKSKDFLDRANLPFFYALPVFVRDLNRDGQREKDLASALRRFARGAQATAQHVLIAGPKGSGKTCLAAGIAAELALNAQNSLFHSYTALLEVNPDGAFKEGDEFAEDGRPNHLGLADAKFLVIDEVPPAFKEAEIAPILNEISKETWGRIAKNAMHTVWIIALPARTPQGEAPPRDVEVIRIWGEALAERLGTAYEPTKPIAEQKLPWVRLIERTPEGKPRIAA
jgi:hypothetical protein